MQFMTTWTIRDDIGDADARIAAGKRVLDSFGRWSVPEGETMIALVARADGNGGYAISDSTDVTALADAAAKFSAWYTWEIVPVMDLTDTKTLEFLLNASTFHD